MSRILATVTVAAVCVLLAGCPSVRHGSAGQLEVSREQSQSAVRTGVLAVDLFTSDQATGQAATVQLSDARDQVAEAQMKVATLTPGSGHELRLQRELAEAMTDATAALNAASAVIRGVDDSRSGGDVRRDLVGVLDELSRAAP